MNTDTPLYALPPGALLPSVSDINWEEEQSFELGELKLQIAQEADTDSGPPWEQCDGHGVVSDWTSREADPSCEWVLAQDRHQSRYYDWRQTLATALKDGWGGCSGSRKAAMKAVREDYEFLKDWCEDRWHYVSVIVRLLDPEGNELDEDSLGGVEDRGDYWKERAVEMAEGLVERHTTRPVASLPLDF